MSYHPAILTPDFGANTFDLGTTVKNPGFPASSVAKASTVRTILTVIASCTPGPTLETVEWSSFLLPSPSLRRRRAGASEGQYANRRSRLIDPQHLDTLIISSTPIHYPSYPHSNQLFTVWCSYTPLSAPPSNLFNCQGCTLVPARETCSSSLHLGCLLAKSPTLACRTS